MDATAQSTPRTDLAVPADKADRDAMRLAVRGFCAASPLVPPVVLDEIEGHSGRLLAERGWDPAYRGFVSLLVGNEAWRGTVAAIPYERRILLLPRCLRSSTACAASYDALGLLCEGCGRCSIDGIQRQAEDLGYAVLVAEGATAVADLISRGEADCVVGVSCMDALEKVFHPLTRHAVPGLAVPLLRNGCVDTQADLDWIGETLRLREDAPRAGFPRVEVKALRREVAGWFEPAALAALLEGSGTATESMALEWLARDGKRWRPTLTAGVYRALAGPGPIPETVRKAAVAVECFHKASLIHDDIEDHDDLRYGVPTFHRQHGLEVAINAGDLLIGEGYRLLAECGATPAQTARLVAVAAHGHRLLCLGQGEELLLRGRSGKPTLDAVLEIFRHKTAPAYQIALKLGALCAQADAGTVAALDAYSEALGIAYQIRDDMADASTPGRSSLLDLPAPRARDLLHDYADRALRALRPLRHPALKGLLFRLVARITEPGPEPAGGKGPA